MSATKPKQPAKTQGGRTAAAKWRAKEKVGVARYGREFQQYLKGGKR